MTCKLDVLGVQRGSYGQTFTFIGTWLQRSRKPYSWFRDAMDVDFVLVIAMHGRQPPRVGLARDGLRKLREYRQQAIPKCGIRFVANPDGGRSAALSREDEQPTNETCAMVDGFSLPELAILDHYRKRTWALTPGT